MGKRWWESCFCWQAKRWEHDFPRLTGSCGLGFGNKALDKSRAVTLFVWERELGKCSRWESVHKKSEAGDRIDLRLFSFLGVSPGTTTPKYS
jgi:hypothetical protein